MLSFLQRADGTVRLRVFDYNPNSTAAGFNRQYDFTGAAWAALAGTIGGALATQGAETFINDANLYAAPTTGVKQSQGGNISPLAG